MYQHDVAQRKYFMDLFDVFLAPHLGSRYQRKTNQARFIRFKREVMRGSERIGS